MFFRASLFGAFGSSKRWLATNPDGSLRPLRTADFYKAGAMTGFVAAFTEGPIDFFKSQIQPVAEASSSGDRTAGSRDRAAGGGQRAAGSEQQVQIIRSRTNPDYKPPFTSVSAAVKSAIRENGFRGPFQGLGATILRNTPANAVYLGTFEVLKRAASERLGTPQSELPAWVVLSSAGLGGICYWAVIFPVDCVKSAMQTDSIVKSQRTYPDMATTARLLWQEGGVKRFYKGFTPCIIRAAPANAAMLFTVDRVTAALNKA
ncbi:hypothetical protein MNEG_10708 [Monoraphidium neglectum]|uniref:Uncharacterized protein n=1 Tax=Monoraphidium neglectum TaxID=145388 RepID=A0A0D2M0T9_9CHLO|nr:hypothetical protein MNEG_10708 [Monoraphidium neglectum]KIY97254.1 hypothetical protein MNEG_10708 [Monoraphidium neglectum]|eukprot:XP_013896274.1 hypothetical protein MNEG_10708 [Monoraphidium neglectum]